VGEPASDLTTLHQGVDIALSLSLLKAVFSRELRHAYRSCSENLPHFALIYARTICLISAAVWDFAAATLEATFVM